MKHVFRSDSIAPVDVDLQKKHLLHVANLDPKVMTEGRVLRTELRNMLVVSRALALLVELLLLQAWDRTFQIVGTRVFMRFPGGDLFGTSRRPATDILPYLKLFQIWRDARLTLSVPVASLQQSAIDDSENDDAVARARATLGDHCTVRAGDSDTNLNDIFLQWMLRCARACEFEVMAGSVEGEVVRAVLPHRARILGPLSGPLPAPRSDDPANRAQEVTAVRRLWLVRTASGNQLLIPRGSEQEAPSPGANIVYAKRDRRTISHWQVLNDQSLMTNRRIPEVDDHE